MHERLLLSEDWSFYICFYSVLEVSVIKVNSSLAARDIIFPNAETLKGSSWGNVHNSIRIPAETLSHNSSGLLVSLWEFLCLFIIVLMLAFIRIEFLNFNRMKEFLQVVVMVYWMPFTAPRSDVNNCVCVLVESVSRFFSCRDWYQFWNIEKIQDICRIWKHWWQQAFL